MLGQERRGGEGGREGIEQERQEGAGGGGERGATGEMKNGYTKVALRAVMGHGSARSVEICRARPAVFKSVSQQPRLANAS